MKVYVSSLLLICKVKQVEHGIFLCQAKYCSCKEASTPIATGCYLDADETGVDVDQTKFRHLIGSLLYLTASRPNIMFSVAYAPDFKLNQRNHTMWQPKEF